MPDQATARRLPSATCRLPTRCLPSARPLSAAFHLPPWPPTATAECQTRPAATTPTLPPIRPIDATIGIAPAPLSDMPPQFRMQFPESAHTRRPINRRISTIRVQILKYTQGNCMRNCSPPDERRPQGPQTHRQTLIMSSLSSVSGTKLSLLSRSVGPTGTKLSQHAQKGPFQPVLPQRGELCTASTPTTPSRENFVPLSPSRCPAGRTMYRSHHHDPQQGELCTAPSAKPGTKLSQHTRSTAVPRKSSPSTPKNGVFASFASAGRIISRTGDRTGSADEGRMR